LRGRGLARGRGLTPRATSPLEGVADDFRPAVLAHDAVRALGRHRRDRRLYRL